MDLDARRQDYTWQSRKELSLHVFRKQNLPVGIKERVFNSFWIFTYRAKKEKEIQNLNQNTEFIPLWIVEIILKYMIKS